MSRPPDIPRDVPEDILEEALNALERLVAIPSIAAESRGVPEAAALVQELLESHGFASEQHLTAGAPVIFAERPAPAGRPTILFYNHYDVQPADPLGLWESEPFTLTERDGALYGRGAADDKGELVSRLAALRWFERRHGELPFGVKFMVEGEEEIGSPNLAQYVAERAELLAADAAVWEFGGVNADGVPATYLGLKGILTLELSVRTAAYDLHSSYGAVVENPIYRLAAALISLRDGDGRVAIEGFYDDVVAPSEAQRELVERLSDEDERLAEVFGTSGFLGGVRGNDFHKRLYFEPNVNYNGFHSGYGGPGAKTVLPAEASAKLDLRLVPDQEPEKVGEQLRRHLDAHGFQDVEMRVLEHSERPARIDVEHPWVSAAVEALRDVYGQEPVVYPNSAGSGPMHPFVEVLGLPVVGIGCGYPGSRIHSPNEHMRLEDFRRGVAALVRLLERYSAGG